MPETLLAIHSILRWIILVLLVVTLYHAFAKKPGIRSSSLWLLIFSHIMLLIGLYQLFWGRYGITKGLPANISLMKNTFYRFFWVEHPLMMILAIILITLARGKAKTLSYKSAGWLLLIALLFILASVPWPFRGDEIARPWFPKM